jgi:RHS repeat-associated protein
MHCKSSSRRLSPRAQPRANSKSGRAFSNQNRSNRNHLRALCASGESRCQATAETQKHQPRFHRTQQYSVTALTDSNGNVTERYAYTAYGTPTITDAAGATRTASADNNRYLYTGREWDETLSLYHYRARMYDATSGRFLSRDPIGYEDGPSLYAYVSLNPVRKLDYSGRGGEDVCVGILNCDPADPTKPMSSTPRPEIKRPTDLCETLAGNCGGCSLTACESALGKIEAAACGNHFYRLPNKCQQFTDNVHPKIGLLALASPCIKSVENVHFTWWVFGGHSAIKVTLCDGSTFFLDYGATSISGFKGDRCPQFALPEDMPIHIW